MTTLYRINVPKCGFCGSGPVGFHPMQDGGHVILRCYECDCVWLTPDHARSEPASYASYLRLADARGIPIESLDGVPYGSWSTFDEVIRAGFENEAILDEVKERPF